MFLKNFQKYGKVPKMILSKHSTFIILTRVVSAFSLSYYYIKLLWSSGQDKNRAYLHSIYCKVKERIHGETSHAISIKRCKCMSGWIDGYGLLLKALVLSLESSLFLLSLSFLDMATPFFLSFLLSFFLGHASSAYHLFSFWGNHNLTLFYFRDVL